MFEGQPKGLFALALANTGERFGYYTMLAVFALFLRANYGLSPALAGTIYSAFLMLVYFFPLIGGIMADKFGFGRMVTTGIMIMFAGYLLLSVPLGGDSVALIVMLAALLLIGFGTGLFKGNLQVMVGDLYNDPQYADKRDSGFSIFYMAINIGALFAPTAAIKIKEYAETSLGYSSNDAYHFSFAVACASLILSIAILGFEWRKKKTFRLWDGLLMVVQGLVGLLLFVMLFSQHPTTSTNLQILLFNPLPFFFLPAVIRKRPTRWWILLAVMFILFMIGSIFQHYAEGMIIVALCLLLRSVIHFKLKA